MHWIVDESTGLYYQPSHDDQPQGGGEGLVANDATDKHESKLNFMPVFFCGTEHQFEKFKKKPFHGYEYAGTEVPQTLIDKYPQIPQLAEMTFKI